MHAIKGLAGSVQGAEGEAMVLEGLGRSTLESDGRALSLEPSAVLDPER